MALPIIADCIRCTVNQSLGTHNIANVIHLRSSGSGSPNADAAADLGAAWIASGSLHTQQSGDLHLNSITTLPLDGSGASQTWFPTSWATTGASGTTTEACQVARVITLKTGFGGRSKRGRMFVAGTPVNQVEPDGTKWTTSSTATYQVAADVFLNALDPGPNGSQLVVASYTLGTMSDVLEVVVREYFGTQRRRALT